MGAFGQSRGFTLLELLIVIGIMGLLGTVSVSGYRGLKSGMEQRAAMQIVDEFVRAAYRRAVIDRAPTAVYFWNETISDETVGKKLVVVGRAVAVRRAGRITEKIGGYLVDEFGDLAYEAYTEESDSGEVEEVDTDVEKDHGRYLYKLGDTQFRRSVVSSTTVPVKSHTDYLMSRPNLSPRPNVRAYGYYVKDEGGVTWQVGDAYGFEIADLTLPKNFIFGSRYSQSVKTPEEGIQVLAFSSAGVASGGSVTVSGLQLDKSGNVAFKSIGTSADPAQDRK